MAKALQHLVYLDIVPCVACIQQQKMQILEAA